MVALVFGLAACQTQPENSDETGRTPARQANLDDARAEVQHMNDRWFELASAGDFDTLVGMYAPDAVVITPYGRKVGRDEILADFQEGYEPEESGSLTTDRIEVAESGDLAYIYGTWSSTVGRSGEYLSVLGRREGGWLWLADAWTYHPERE
jgi:ketosteroid isomerase-like protein